MEHDLAVENLRQKGLVEREKYKWDTITNFFTGHEGRKRMMNLLGFTAGCITVYYTGKVLAPLASQALNNRLFKPQLAKTVAYNSPVRTAIRNIIPQYVLFL